MNAQSKPRIVNANIADYQFDPDAWHVMQERDNTLIEQEILYGAGSNKFIYSFYNGAEQVCGVSVVGARHLAATYGSIKHKLIGSVAKTGKQMLCMTYPEPNVPMGMHCLLIPELEKEPDFYTVIVEIQDLKTGNTLQVETTELRLGLRNDKKTTYERAHYKTIAQSKAFRNGVLAIVPQDIVLQWKANMLSLGQNDLITADVLAAKRAGVLRYASKIGLPINRQALEKLLLEQIAGLADAAVAEQHEGFRKAATALRLLEVPGQGKSAWDGAWKADPKPAPDATPKAKPRDHGNAASGPTRETGGATGNGWQSGPPDNERFGDAAPGEYRLWDADGIYLLSTASLVEFAQVYLEHLQDVPADLLEAFEARNADTLAEALADPEAASILRDAAAPTDGAEEFSPGALKVTVPGGRLTDAQIIGCYADALDTVNTVPMMAAWQRDNLAAVKALHGRLKMPVFKVMGGRCRALGIELRQ